MEDQAEAGPDRSLPKEAAPPPPNPIPERTKLCQTSTPIWLGVGRPTGSPPCQRAEITGFGHAGLRAPGLFWKVREMVFPCQRQLWRGGRCDWPRLVWECGRRRRRWSGKGNAAQPRICDTRTPRTLTSIVAAAGEHWRIPNGPARPSRERPPPHRRHRGGQGAGLSMTRGGPELPPQPTGLPPGRLRQGRRGCRGFGGGSCLGRRDYWSTYEDRIFSRLIYFFNPLKYVLL